MNVLVTGATGFVGRVIVAQLSAAGHEVHALSRAARMPGETFPSKIHPGNVLDSATLNDACKGMDDVIHLVGIISEARRNTFEGVHVEGTRNMVAAARQAGVKRFIHMSALGTRSNAVSRYHRSKWQAEEIVRGSGLEWTIFRPSIIYGPGDGFVNLFAKIIRRSPIVPIIGSGRSKFQPVPVGAVAAAFVKSLDEPRAIGRVFDLCGTETISLNEIVDEILLALKRRRLKLHVPIRIARIQAALMELFYAKSARKAPPLNRDQIIMLQEDNTGEGREADELFGVERISFADGIRRYLKP